MVRRISNSSLRVTQSCLQSSMIQDSEEIEEDIPMEEADCEIIELSDVDERLEVDSQWQSMRHMHLIHFTLKPLVSMICKKWNYFTEN